VKWRRAEGHVALPASVHVEVNGRGVESYVAIPVFFHLDLDRSGVEKRKKRGEWIGEEQATLLYPLPST